MNFQDAVKTCLTKYVDFAGRASRSEYWWFVLFCLILNVIALLISHTLYSLVGLVLFLPSLAVLVRRLHDTNRTGWWALLLFIPIIGALIILYFMISEGTSTPNEYGNPPLV